MLGNFYFEKCFATCRAGFPTAQPSLVKPDFLQFFLPPYRHLLKPQGAWKTGHIDKGLDGDRDPLNLWVWEL